MRSEEATESQRAAVAFGRSLLLLTVLGLLVRIAFLLAEPSVGPVADERTWTNWAVEGLVTPRVHFDPLRIHMIFYPPLYPYFIAVFYAAFGTLTAVKWAQALAGALLVPAVGRLGGRALGSGAGLTAAAVAACYPELVWFSVHFWSETLYMALLWWAFERLLAADATGGRATAAVAGLLWGLAILTRENSLYFTPIVVVWLARNRGRTGGAGRAAAFALAAVLTVVPWTLRNWMVFRTFIPVSTAGGLNLYQGNAPLTREEVYARYEAVQGRVEQYRWAQREGLKAIWKRQPWWAFEKLRDEMPTYWEADAQPLYHLKRGAYGPVSPASARFAAAVVALPYLLTLGLFVAGVAAADWDRRRALLILFLLYYNAIHVATHGYARYRLPSLPVLFLFAASAWAAWRAGPFPRLSTERKALAAVLAAILAASVAPSLWHHLQEPAFGFAGGETPPEQAPTP